MHFIFQFVQENYQKIKATLNEAVVTALVRAARRSAVMFFVFIVVYLVHHINFFKHFEPRQESFTAHIGATLAEQDCVPHGQAGLPPFEEKNKKDRPTSTLATIINVVDGDTIDVLINCKKERVRLIGVDTPETVDPRKPVQCFGKEASEYSKQHLANSSIRLQFDSSQDFKDKYGRLLAYVFLSRATSTLEDDFTINYNQQLIAEGYAHEYTYRIPYMYQKEFKAEQNKARIEKKGLWAEGVCS